MQQPVTFASGSMLTPTTTTVLDLGATGVGYVDARTILAFAEAVRTTFPPAEDYYLPRCVCVCTRCVSPMKYGSRVQLEPPDGAL